MLQVFKKPQAVARSSEEIFQGAFSQANIMKYVGHEHIVHLYDTYFEGDNLYVVMELCGGDDLFQWLCDRMQLQVKHCSANQAIRTTLIFRLQQGQGLSETDARTIAYNFPPFRVDLLRLFNTPVEGTKCCLLWSTVIDASLSTTISSWRMCFASGLLKTLPSPCMCAA